MKKITAEQAIIEGWFTPNNNNGLCECGYCEQPAPVARESSRRRGWVSGEAKHFLNGHNARDAQTDLRAAQRTAKLAALDVLRERVQPRIKITEAGCWEWQGPIGDHGYATVTIGSLRGELAHRAVYRVFVGRLVKGMHIDHVCKNRKCVNPFHLEQVTPRENVVVRAETPSGVNSRKTECIRGHAFDDVNTYVTPKGERQCRRCRNAAERAGRQRRRLRYARQIDEDA